MKKVGLFVKWCLLGAIVPAVFFCAIDAAELKGSVSVERDNARQITGAFLHVGNQPYSIIMDENGRSLAQMYEHKELKVECTINGNQIKLDTWEEIKPPPSAPEPVYNDPEPKYERDDDDEEEVKEPGDEEGEEGEEKHGKDQSDDEENEDQDSENNEKDDVDEENTDEDSY
jgi:hypothetical protein